jgi:heptosyltransferase I
MENNKTQTLNPKKPTIGVLRLSALGDVTNALAAVTAIRKHIKDKQIVWFVGKTEYELLKNIEDIHFEIINKKKSFSEFLRLKKKFKDIKFEALLHMQRSLRCSLISLALSSKRVIGFDKSRAKELQSFFTNESIETPKSAHAVDVFMEFSYKLGVPKTQEPEWDFGVDFESDSTKGAESNKDTKSNNTFKLPESYISIVVAGSQEDRSWSHLNNAKVIEWIYEHTDLDVVLLGGPTRLEILQRDKIIKTLKASKKRCDLKIYNLVGKTNLRNLMFVIKGSSLVISPDTGPIHIASALRVKTLGLYVHMPKEITGPYNFLDTTIDKYRNALKTYYNIDALSLSKNKSFKNYEGIPKRNKHKDCSLDLIKADEVIKKLSEIPDIKLDKKSSTGSLKKDIDL